MTRPAPTEARLESARCVDRLPVKDALSLIFEEDARAHRALGAVLPQLAQAVDVLVECIEAGGRWFNVGAGTSGRLGVLDAAEIPPTFGMPPDRVQGVLAGGDRALRAAVEGAEDDSLASARELEVRGLGPADAVGRDLGERDDSFCAGRSQGRIGRWSAPLGDYLRSRITACPRRRNCHGAQSRP